MSIAEEKSTLLKKVMSNRQCSSSNHDIEDQLYALLMKDTVSGKLYKYRSFDSKGYSLMNFEAGTLHCSKPSDFNDPFDCRVGFTVQAFIEACYDQQLESFETIYFKCIDVLSGRFPYSHCTTAEKKIIRELQQNTPVMDFLGLCGNPVLSIEKKQELVKEHGFEVLSILTTILSEKIFKDQLPFVSQAAETILQRLAINGSMSIDQPLENLTFGDVLRSYHITADADEISLYMLLIKQIHPEFGESAEQLEAYLNALEANVFDILCSKMLVGCLCTDYKNSLMWSHYADSHRGFCIEYDFSGMEEKNKVLPFPVIYSTEMPKLSLKYVLNRTEKNEQLGTQSLMSALLTKDMAWEYENEWRLLCEVDGDDDNSNDIEMPPISCVYVGAMATEENVSKLSEIAKRKGIPLKRMKLDRGAYLLHTE